MFTLDLFLGLVCQSWFVDFCLTLNWLVCLVSARPPGALVLALPMTFHDIFNSIWFAHLTFLTCSWIPLLDLFLGFLLTCPLNAYLALWLVSSSTPAWGTWRLRGSVGFGVLNPNGSNLHIPPLYPDIPFWLVELYILNRLQGSSIPEGMNSLALYVNSAGLRLNLWLKTPRGLGSRSGIGKEGRGATDIAAPPPRQQVERGPPPFLPACPLFTFLTTLLTPESWATHRQIVWDKFPCALCIQLHLPFLGVHPMTLRKRHKTLHCTVGHTHTHPSKSKGNFGHPGHTNPERVSKFPGWFREGS